MFKKLIAKFLFRKEIDKIENLIIEILDASRDEKISSRELVIMRKKAFDLLLDLKLDDKDHLNSKMGFMENPVDEK